MKQRHTDELAHLRRGWLGRAAVAEFGARAQIDPGDLIGADVAVGEQRALGLPGGARGVVDRGIVLGIQCAGRQFRGIRFGEHIVPGVNRRRQRAGTAHDDGGFQIRQCGQMRFEARQTFGVDHQQAAARVRQRVGEFAAGQPGVQRHDDGADRHAGPEHHRPFGIVAHRQRHAIALADTEARRHGVGERGNPAVVLGVGMALAFVHQIVAFGELRRVREHRAQMGKALAPALGFDAPDVECLDREWRIWRRRQPLVQQRNGNGDCGCCCISGHGRSLVLIDKVCPKGNRYGP